MNFTLQYLRRDKGIRILAFLAFYVLTLVLYYPAAKAGLVHDFIGWVYKYATQGPGGLKHLFGDKGLHPFYQLLFCCVYKLASFNYLPWFLIFTGLHALNAFLSFTFFSRFFGALKVENSLPIAFAGSLLFLISPYNTEVLVWKATIHYLTATALILSCLICCLNYLQTNSVKHLVFIHIFYVVAIFSLEIAFSTPFLLIILVFVWQTGRLNRLSLIPFLWKVIVPQLLMLPLYFLFTKLFLGKWVGHYGAAAHFNFAIPLLVGNLNKYLLKFFCLFQFVSFSHRHKIYEWLEHPTVAYVFFTLYALLAGAVFAFYRKLPAAFQIALALLLMALAAMITTLNLFFTYVVNIEGDRLCYLALVFSNMFIAYIAWQFYAPLKYTVLILFTFFSLKYLHYNIESWKNEAVVQQSLTAGFNCPDKGEIYILNIPDNFRGAYLFRVYDEESTFTECLDLERGVDVRNRCELMLFYNMNSISDSVTVEKLDSNTLKVSLAQWGNWWWRYGIGAADYSTDKYSIKIDSYNHSYIVKFKNRKPDDVFLYQCGTNWRRVSDF